MPDALIEMAGLRYVLISLDRDGLYLAGKETESLKIPSRPKGDVVDISGAGDIIVSVMAWLLGCGADVRDAAMLANVAAGVATASMAAANSANGDRAIISVSPARPIGRR